MAREQELVAMAPHAIACVLPNGVPVFVEERSTRTAIVSVWFRAGSRHESPAERGVTHLLEHLYLRPRGGDSSWQLAVEENGGIYNGVTAREFLSFYYQVPAPLAIAPLALFIDQLLALHELSPAEIAAQKGLVEEELILAADTLDEVVGDRLHAALLSSDLGRSVGGTLAEIRALTIDNVLTARQRRWNASHLAIVVSGLSAELVMDVLAETAATTVPKGSLVGGNETWSGDEEAHAEPATSADDVAWLGFGHLGAAFGDHQRAVIDVGIALLGGSFSSRAASVLRDEKGLVYGLDGWHNPYSDSGLAQLIMQTSGDKVESTTEAFAAIVDEVLTSQPPTDAELAVARRQALGRRFAEWELSSERVVALGAQALAQPDNPSLRPWAKAVVESDREEITENLKRWSSPSKVLVTRED